MKLPRFALAILLFFVAFASNAATITINLNNAPYNSDPRFSGVGVISDIAERQGALWNAYGVYKTNNLGPQINKGDVIKVTYQDGSSERALVDSLFSHAGIKPIPGTQSSPEGGGPGYTHNSSGGYLGGPTVVGFRPTYNYITVCVGGVCESSWVITGYEWEFRSGTHAV
jgi:hypothetical protein